MRTVSYRGYQASVEFDDGSLFVKVLHIDDLLVAEIDKASDAQKAIVDLIEAYLLDCAEEGRAPTKPFKGSFNVRVTPELHKRAAMRAAEEGMTLNSWVCASIEEKLECGKLSDRIDGVFSKTKVQVDTASIAHWIAQSLQQTQPVRQSVRLPQRRWNQETQFDDTMLRKTKGGSPWVNFDA